jgi:hypothetical protein
MTVQQRWNRYVGAINYVIAHGFYVNCIDSKDDKGEWNGNMKAIKVTMKEDMDEVVIPLQPRKYGKQELLYIVLEAYGMNNFRRAVNKLNS